MCKPPELGYRTVTVRWPQLDRLWLRFWMPDCDRPANYCGRRKRATSHRATIRPDDPEAARRRPTVHSELVVGPVACPPSAGLNMTASEAGQPPRRSDLICPV